ncbi:hypothetical protein Peur_008364 [Populus x canadensis]
MCLFILYILLTGSKSTSLTKLILLLSLKFKLQEDLCSIYYFLGIEVKRTSIELIITQHKYALDILYRAYMFSCKPIILQYLFFLQSWPCYLVVCTLALHAINKLLVLFSILPSQGLICAML